MPIVLGRAPKASVNKLLTIIELLAPIKNRRKTWMRIRLASVRRQHLIYPHPVYHAQLQNLLAGRPLRAILRRIAWMYFLRNNAGQLACVEISSFGGRHKNFRLMEGPFVSAVFTAIEKSKTDRRLSRHSFHLRSIRVESLHAFVLWFKAATSVEYWVPVTQIGSARAVGQWLSRKEFVQLLMSEGLRVAETHKRYLQITNTDSAIR